MLLFFCWAVSFACAKPVEGQVFVSTQGGAAVKLALARVYVLRGEEIETFVAARTRAQQEIVRIVREGRAAVAARKNAVGERLEDIGSAELNEKARRVAELEAVHLDLAKANPEPATGTRKHADWKVRTKVHELEIARFNLEEEKKSAAMRKNDAIRRAEAEVAAIDAGLRKIEAEIPEALRMAGLLTPRAEEPATLTDADGEFAIDVPSGAVLLIASERSVGGTKEHYRWVVRADRLVGGKRVLFSNHNVVGTGGPEQLFQ